MDVWRKKCIILITILIFLGLLVCFVLIKNDKNGRKEINSLKVNEKKDSMNLDYKKYYYLDSHIAYIPGRGSYRKHAEMQKQSEIKSAVKFLNHLKILPLEKTYEYQGGDSPAAWIYLYYDSTNKDISDEIIFYEDLDHSIVIRLRINSNYRYFKIDITEYEKLKNLFELE